MAHQPRFLRPGLPVLLLVGVLLSGLAKAAEVRYYSFGDVTRIVVPTDGDKPVRTDRLSNPDRVFFDIRTPKLLVHHRKVHTIQVGDTYVRQIRVAETQPGLTRVVVDLTGSSEFNIIQRANPDRVVIEVRARGSAPPVKLADRVLRTYVPPTVAPRSAPAAVAEAEIDLPRPVAYRRSVADLPRLPGYPGLPRMTAAVPPLPPATVAASTPRATLTQSPELATAARRTSEGDRTLARVLGLKMGRVVIDAGHGGHDVGTSGPGGLYEKDLVLDVAKRVGALIEQRLGCEVVYTRGDDTFVPLERRTEFANQQKADLFLSIHANSSPSRAASGVETYYLSFTTAKDALDVAARENAASQNTLYDLNDLLKKIALKDKVDESREFAASVQSSLYAQSVRSNVNAKDRGVRKAPFIVLIGAQMPSILAEIGFISNSHDEAMMRRPEHRQKIAEALYKGVAQYAGTLSHFQVARQTATSTTGR